MEQQVYLFEQLTTTQLYRILQLRLAVFCVEQTCYYQDADGLDLHPETRHLMLLDGEEIAAYTRILAPGVSYPEYSSIGRVVNDNKYRRQGLGHKLIRASIEVCEKLWPESDIKISAQQHLESFYAQHGFVTATEPYLEDGIPHVGMIKEAKRVA